jgi:acetyl-CoA synthetase
MARCPQVAVPIIASGEREGWHSCDSENEMFRGTCSRPEDAASGGDPMLMYFTSGTTGYPKIALHPCTYPLGHFITAKYWHCVDPDGIHFTISDPGWGKAVWGKLYAQWLCEAGVVSTYDFDKFDPADILPMFCPNTTSQRSAHRPTMYRFLIKEDLSKYTCRHPHDPTAGERQSPRFSTSLKRPPPVRHGGLWPDGDDAGLGSLVGMTPRVGSMVSRRPCSTSISSTGRQTRPASARRARSSSATTRGARAALLRLLPGRREDAGRLARRSVPTTGDTAWKDEWLHTGSSGVRTTSSSRPATASGRSRSKASSWSCPTVLECAVSPAPNEIRGQVVKASIVLTEGTPSRRSAQNGDPGVRQSAHGAVQVPRHRVFRRRAAKTISGKIQGTSCNRERLCPYKDYACRLYAYKRGQRRPALHVSACQKSLSSLVQTPIAVAIKFSPATASCLVLGGENCLISML